MAQTHIPYLIANSWAEIGPIFAITQLRDPWKTEPLNGIGSASGYEDNI